MAVEKGIVEPRNYPIRKPTDANLVNGRNANPPRFMEVGGLKGPGVWFKETGDNQSPQKNIARVERATSTAPAKKSSERDYD